MTDLPQPLPHRAARRWSVYGALLLGLLACWQGRDVPGFEFVPLDDDINILFNAGLGPPSGETLRWMFTDLATMRRYVPLGWLAFSGVYAFSGLSPVGYHLANVALQGVNSMLVFAVLLALLRRYASEGGGDAWRVTCAAAAAALWSLHPMRAETVGWASGLLYGVSGCFALGSALVYLRIPPGASAPGSRRIRLMGAAGLYACSVLAYPMALGLPGAFLMLDVADTWRGGEWRRRLREKLIFALPLVAALGITFWAGSRASNLWPGLPSVAELGPGARLGRFAEAWFYFVWRPWWPVDLTPVPTALVDPHGRGLASVLALAALAAITLGLLRPGRWRRGGLLLWLAHLALLVPLLGLAEKTYFPADRYHTLAGVVLSCALALGAAGLTGGWARRAVVAGAAIAAVGLAIAQHRQLAIWADTDALMGRILAQASHPAVRADYQARWIKFHASRGDERTATRLAAQAGTSVAVVMGGDESPVPLAARVHLQMARRFLQAGRGREAQEHFTSALEIAPQWREAAYNWAVVLALAGDGPEALHGYRRALAGTTGAEISPEARRRLLELLGEAFAAQGQHRLARRSFEAALEESESASAADAEALRAQLARYRSAAGEP